MAKGELKSKINIFLIIIISICIVGCNNFFGIYPISENLLLWDAGASYEKMIIYNDGGIHWKRVSGCPIIPSDTQYQLNAFAGAVEYVDFFSNNKEWLLAKTIVLADSTIQDRYWIIHFSSNGKMNKKDVADSTLGPLDKLEFDSVVGEMNINKSLLTSFVMNQ